VLAYFIMDKKSNLSVVKRFLSSIASHLPGFATFEKIIEEFLEHKEFATWVFVRIIIPIILFHALLSIFIFERFRFSPAIFGIVVFFYSTFLVDLDSFFGKTTTQKTPSWKRAMALFLAPLVIYYTLSKKVKPVCLPHKYFHRKKSMFIYSFFLFFLGLLIFFNWWDALFFALLGFAGYLTHLVTDKVVSFNKSN